ncbi:MAG TPA: TfpX/TfpZ family type IV pilin accessory protein [Methylophilaceae bacterium]|nr:TfpX/TfpZ family type IV pilin accessory protein [Methylophilaceae bacterium]
MSRFRAAGIHLLISVFIVITVLGLMLGVWYPGAYFKLMGGGGLIFIMAGVDVCLGPLLTLIVFKSGKKTLKFDLTVIGLLQIAALSYGAHIMFQARPVFTVFTNDQFQVAIPADIEPKYLAKASREEWKHFSLSGPVLVGAAEPKDEKEKQDIIFLGAAGVDWQQLPELYVKYEDQRASILRKARPLLELRKIAKTNPAAVDAFLKSQSRPEQDFVFLPIRTLHAEMAVILDAKSAKIIDIIDAVPWS